MTKELNFQSSLKGTIIGANNESVNSLTNNLRSLRSPERNLMSLKNRDLFQQAMFKTTCEFRKEQALPLKEEILESLNTSYAAAQDCQPTAKKDFVSSNNNAKFEWS